MTAILPLVCFAGCVAGGLLFLASACVGLRRGKLYYEPSRPPIKFGTAPKRFVLLLALFLVLGLVMSYGAFLGAASLWNGL